MKTTLGDLLDPRFDHYSSIGEMAQCLHLLLISAKDYRDRGAWGDCGPHEILCGYGGCTNSLSHGWHSSRICSTTGMWKRATTWQENHDNIRNCILSALCARGGAHGRWQLAHNLSLRTEMKWPMAYQHQGLEKEAWKDFGALHKCWLGRGTLNTCHRNVSLLAEPQLIVSRDGIFISCEVTDKTEIRTSPVCYSRWSVCSLMRDNTYFSREPKWCPQRETFAKFVVRAAEFYRSIPLKKNSEVHL